MNVIVFDLDDTLAYERDFLLSGFRAVGRILEVSAGAEFAAEAVIRMSEASEAGHNHYSALEELVTERRMEQRVDIVKVVSACRSHIPDSRYCLIDGAEDALRRIAGRGDVCGLITDGRALTQRHKIEALGLWRLMAPEDIWISGERGCDKLTKPPFRHFMSRYPDAMSYTYIGDNPAKDFIVANSLGWQTIMLRDRGRNVHSQHAEVPKMNAAIREIDDFEGL